MRTERYGRTQISSTKAEPYQPVHLYQPIPLHVVAPPEPILRPPAQAPYVPYIPKHDDIKHLLLPFKPQPQTQQPIVTLPVILPPNVNIPQRPAPTPQPTSQKQKVGIPEWWLYPQPTR